MPRLRILDVNEQFLETLNFGDFDGDSLPELKHLKYRAMVLQPYEYDNFQKKDRWERYGVLVYLQFFADSSLETLTLCQALIQDYDEYREDVGILGLKALNMDECFLTPDFTILLGITCRHIQHLSLVDCEYFYVDPYTDEPVTDTQGNIMLSILEAIGGSLVKVELVRSDVEMVDRWFKWLPKCTDLIFSSLRDFRDLLSMGSVVFDDTPSVSILDGLPPSIERLSIALHHQSAEPAHLHYLFQKLQDQRFLPQLQAVPVVMRNDTRRYSKALLKDRDAASAALHARGLQYEESKMQGSLFDITVKNR